MRWWAGITAATCVGGRRAHLSVQGLVGNHILPHIAIIIYHHRVGVVIRNTVRRHFSSCGGGGGGGGGGIGIGIGDVVRCGVSRRGVSRRGVAQHGRVGFGCRSS